MISILFLLQIHMLPLMNSISTQAQHSNGLSPSKSFSPGGSQASSPLDSPKVLDLQKAMRSLEEAAEQREKQLAELTASLEEAQEQQASLQLEKDDAQAENAELLQNYTRLQASVAELQTRVQEQEGKALQKAQLDHEIQGLRKALAGVQFLLDGVG